MIGSACAAVISIGTGVQAYSIGVGGLPGILSIMPQYWLNFLIAMLVAIVVPFALTILVGSRKLSREDRGINLTEAEAVSVAPDQGTKEEEPAPMDGVTAPLSGRIIPMEEIPDQVFSQGF